jgi:radical SAM protein with 4Fe4S-binding SPASM domain
MEYVINMSFESSSSLISQLQKKCLEENIPLGVLFELTNKCNLKCRHCYMVRDDSIELSSDEVMDIIDQLVDIGTYYLGFTGGEIFTRDDLFDILKYAKSKGFVLSLLTNGTLITPEQIEEIKKLKPSSFEISLYGSTANTHDNITRIKGSFEKTMETVEAIIRNNMKVTIKTPLMNLNIRELDDIAAVCKVLGVKHRMNPGIVPARNGSKSPLQYDLSDEDLKSYLSNHDLNVLSYLYERDFTQRFICTAGKALCGITASGIVYPCIMMPIPVGNLRKKKFKEIWNVMPSYELKRVRALKIRDLPSCSACNLRKFCIRCPGVVYHETGDIVGETPTICRIAAGRKYFDTQPEVAVNANHFSSSDL